MEIIKQKIIFNIMNYKYKNYVLIHSRIFFTYQYSLNNKISILDFFFIILKI